MQYRITELTEFPSDIIFSFSPESTKERLVENSHRIKDVLYVESMQYVDLLEAYLYAQNEILDERKLLIEEKLRLEKEARLRCASGHPSGLSVSDIRELEESGIAIPKTTPPAITTMTVSSLLAFSMMSPEKLITQLSTTSLTSKPRNDTEITGDHPLENGMRKMLSNTP